VSLHCSNLWEWETVDKMRRQFIAHFWFVGWDCISFGFHVCFTKPNIEIHLPFGFIRIGWTITDPNNKPINHDSLAKERAFGLTERYN